MLVKQKYAVAIVDKCTKNTHIQIREYQDTNELNAGLINGNSRSPCNIYYFKKFENETSAFLHIEKLYDNYFAAVSRLSSKFKYFDEEALELSIIFSGQDVVNFSRKTAVILVKKSGN